MNVETELYLGYIEIKVSILKVVFYVIVETEKINSEKDKFSVFKKKS